MIRLIDCRLNDCIGLKDVSRAHLDNGRLTRCRAGWQLPPVAAALYGSAARHDGDAASDIDILLVRPASLGSRERELWNDQVHWLRGLVQRWTGNRCQVTDRTVAALRRLSRARAHR